MSDEPVPRFLDGTRYEVDDEGEVHLARAEPVCDFCLGGGVCWSYPATPMRLPLHGSIDATKDDWACCAECHDLLERQDWRALAVRCLENQLTAFKEGVDLRKKIERQPSLRVKILARLVTHFLDFQEHRNGPPVAWPPESAEH